MSELPPLPPGFVLQEGNSNAAPPPPPGFVMQGGSDEAAPESFHRSLLLPVGKDLTTGEIQPALPRLITGIPDAVAGIPGAIANLPSAAKNAVVGAYNGIVSGVTAPGDAMSGRLPVFGPDGNVSDEAIQRGFDFASIASPVNPGVRAGDTAFATFTHSTPKAPTAEVLKEAADKGYKAAREMGVEYSSQSVADMAKRTQATLEADGFSDVTAPKTFATLQKLQNPPENSVATLSNVDAARRSFGKIGQDFANPTDRAAGKRARGDVDVFLVEPPEGAVLAGDGVQASRTIADARGNIAASKRSDTLTGIERSAELRAAASNSGANAANAIRQRTASLLENPKRLSGFNDAETALIERVARGDAPTNLSRALGNFLGGGGGLGATASTALTGAGAVLATGNPYAGAAGLAAPVAGVAGKAISEALTRRALSAADEAVRMRSPLYQQMAKGSVPVASSAGANEAVIKALILANQRNGGGGW